MGGCRLCESNHRLLSLGRQWSLGTLFWSGRHRWNFKRGLLLRLREEGAWRRCGLRRLRCVHQEWRGSFLCWSLWCSREERRSSWLAERCEREWLRWSRCSRCKRRWIHRRCSKGRGRCLSRASRRGCFQFRIDIALLRSKQQRLTLQRSASHRRLWWRSRLRTKRQRRERRRCMACALRRHLRKHEG